MAAVTGPTSTLPGHRHPLPPSMACDHHHARPAVARIQGETDSMGAELNDYCQECLDKYNAQIQAARAAEQAGMVQNWCDHCKALIPARVWPCRDPDEGPAGPVYDLCAAHRRKLAAYHRGE